MARVQLVKPNLNVKGSVGYCLEYAQDMFGAKPVNDYAWEAWEATKYKHLTRSLPPVAVPMWYSYTGTIKGVKRNWGHVTVWVPGKGIYSSPWQYGTDHAVLNSIEDVERIYGAQYVGWSGDIEGLRVAEWESPPLTKYIAYYDTRVRNAPNLKAPLSGKRVIEKGKAFYLESVVTGDKVTGYQKKVSNQWGKSEWGNYVPLSHFKKG